MKSSSDSAKIDLLVESKTARRVSSRFANVVTLLLSEPDDGDDEVMFFRGLKSNADIVEIKFRHNSKEKQLATHIQNVSNYVYTIP